MGINLGRWAASVAPLAGAVGGAFAGNPALGYMTGGMVGDALDPNKSKREADAQRQAEYANQKEFAQMGVRWRVADARAAGIHPLAALGAQTQSYAPQAVGGDYGGTDTYAQMGQALGNISTSTQTDRDRQMQDLQIQGAQLDNQNRGLDAIYKQQQIDENNRRMNPPFPDSGQSFMPGQGNSGRINNVAQERTKSAPDADYSQPGAHNSVGWEKTPTGVVAVPSKDSKELIEDNTFHEARHFMRNNVAPNFGNSDVKPPQSALPKGHYWRWSYEKQEWQPKRLKDLQDKYRGTKVPYR